MKTKSNFLLDEIKEITLSEEKNRETITKLKSEYRAKMTFSNRVKMNVKFIRKYPAAILKGYLKILIDYFLIGFYIF